MQVFCFPSLDFILTEYVLGHLKGKNVAMMTKDNTKIDDWLMGDARK